MFFADGCFGFADLALGGEHAPLGRTRLDLDGESLCSDVVAVFDERCGESGVAGDAQADAIGDVELGVLARLLDHAHEVTGEAFALELGSWLRVENDE